MKTSHKVLALSAAVLLALGAGLFLARDALREKAASVALVGGPFRLASSRGGEVDSESLRGKPYAIFFGFTHCPEVCPTTLYEMSTLLAKLGDDAKDLRVFFVTVDPARDTLEAMRDYVSNFDPRIEALVPTEAQLARIAADFRVYYARVPTSDGGYTMDHTALVYLMDADGDFSGTISYGEALETQEAKLRKLISAR
ncbi:SCO family protein [Aestuariivirga sp.]|uniref:SCO family protein n=1 Tax=Aestuariivirga sp. TaxID=2650926 RepID=UPI00391C9C93